MNATLCFEEHEEVLNPERAYGLDKQHSSYLLEILSSLSFCSFC